MREATSTHPAAPSVPVPTSGHTDQVDKDIGQVDEDIGQIDEDIGQSEDKLAEEMKTARCAYYLFDQFDHVEEVTHEALSEGGKKKHCGDPDPVVAPSGKVCRQL